jgi:aspartate/methionine/tyrosine aminotransferase
MSKLAAAHGSVNLGQGFPDDEGPDSMKRVAADALFQHHNQYPPMPGETDGLDPPRHGF